MGAALTLAVLALLVAAPLPPSSAQGAEGCRAEGDAFRCEWYVEVDTGQIFSQFGLRTFPSSLATMTVTLEGQDHGWSYTVVAEDLVGSGERQLSAARHYPSDDPMDAGDSFAAQTDTHLLLPGEGQKVVIHFTNAARRGVEDVPLQPPVTSTGTFRITVLSERLPDGVAPARPAATVDDPHLSDPSDAARPEHDLRAVWFDDAALEDGLFEAHVALDGWGPFDLNASQGAKRVESWYLGFRVMGEDYVVRWFVALDADGGLEQGCELRRGVFDPRAATQTSTLIMSPSCEFGGEEPRLVARIPERSVGSPAPGAPFESVVARSVRWTTTLRFTSSLPEQLDVADAPRYAFALGGPAVWSGLNPRLDPPAEVVPPWFQAPLHEQNVPDTLQVAGAGLATLTFLGGAVLLQRNRRQTRQLLTRVDDLVERHERSVRDTLLALGVLETEFTREFRKGRLNEAQYQVAVQRIASAAARLALRKELGLDDGVPGDATAEPSRRVPVEAPPVEDRPRV